MGKFSWDYPAKANVLSHVRELALRQIVSICKSDRTQEANKVDIIRGVLGLYSEIEREVAENEDD